MSSVYLREKKFVFEDDVGQITTLFSPSELQNYILRGAAFHLDIEGGLVHLASQLDTKCVVLFGPTPIAYYGYQTNINIQAGECHGCYWLENDYQQCYRRMAKPECMHAITPELVMERVRSELGGIMEKQGV